ncbi:MAG: plasmid mobilization protein [Deltaproteobacteria bacterium]
MPSYKTPQVNFVCSKEQHDEIAKRAKQYNMSIAEYCRFVSLNAKIEVTAGTIKKG